MNQKVTPYIFLGVLFIVLVFLGGIKFGKKVARTDAVLNYVKSIAPTVASSPTPQEPLTFSTFKSEGCGISFLYPSLLKVEKNASDEALITSSTSDSVHIVCKTPNDLQKNQEDPKLATAEVTLNKLKIDAKEDKKGMLYFQTKNQITGKSLFISIDKNIYPLFEKTVTFSR